VTVEMLKQAIEKWFRSCRLGYVWMVV